MGKHYRFVPTKPRAPESLNNEANAAQAMHVAYACVGDRVRAIEVLGRAAELGKLRARRNFFGADLRLRLQRPISQG